MIFDIEFYKIYFVIDKINKVYIGKGGGVEQINYIEK